MIKLGEQRAGSILSGVCLIALFLATVCPAGALDPTKAFSQYASSSWTHRNGLESKSVMSIAQTSDGFLWLATEQGLVRYDGVTMITFDERNAPELGNRFIRSLAPDPDGSLWIGTSTGVAHYSGGKFKNYGHESKAPWDIYDVCADGQGGVWFSSNVGLYHFANGSRRIYTTAEGLPSNGITSLAKGADGTLWFSTLTALVSFKAGRFTTYSDWIGFHENPINAISIGADGAVWIGMKNGVLGRWANGRITTWWNGAEAHGNRIECMHQDRDGTLWIAVRKLGLVRMRGHSVQVLTPSDGLPGSSPDWIFEDRENSLWIGWADAGLSMLRDTKFTTFGKREGLSSDNISSVTQAADGGLWVGTSDNGLDHVDGTHVRAITESDGLAQNEVLGLLQQRDGTLWVGSQNGQVTKIKNGQTTVLPVSPGTSPEVRAMAEDRAGLVWFGRDQVNGLATLHNHHFVAAAMEGPVRSLSFGADGALWVSSYLLGLARFKDGVSHLYTRKDGLPSVAITSVYADRAGAVWAGTALSGIVRWKDGKFTCYSTQQGLFDNAVAGIMEDDHGYLWMGGSRGIWRVRMQELNDFADGRQAFVHSEVYGYSDGLRSVETSFVAQPSISKGADGRLWFATSGGLSMIDPGRIVSNTTSPDVVIEKVLFDGSLAPLVKGRIQPSPGNGDLDIAFTAASFVAPENMRFRYRLLGADKEWVEAGARRIASYSRLRPGSYHFELQAANNDGVWSRNPAKLDLTLAAHPYQALWFRACVGIWIALVVWRVHAARMRYFTRKTQKLEEIISLRTAEVRNALQIAERAQAVLLEQATKDSLTGLWNRRAIFEILDRELKWCREEAQPLCVLMVDADHFKSINDTFGHLAGDLVIRTISQRLTRGLRKNEIIGRYGGEEILVLLPRCRLTSGMARAEELRSLIEQNSVFYEGKEIWVTCSFGLAHLSTAKISAEIVEEADQALYLAKREGRNCVRTLNAHVYLKSG